MNFDDAVMSEDSIFCRWDLTSSNATELGCKGELKLHGMLKAVYSVYNKLIYVEETFDVMSFMQQLRRISGKNDFLVSLYAIVLSIAI